MKEQNKMESVVHYQVKIEDLDAHLLRVSCELEQPSQQGQCFRLPNWVPGSYLIRDFSGRVVGVEASDAKGDYQPERLNKSCWRCRPTTGPLCFSMIIHALDDSVRAAWLDRDHAFFNGAALLPEAVDVSGPFNLTVHRPALDLDMNWRVATSMPGVEINAEGFGEYQCADYRELIDHPFLIGELEQLEFETSGCKHTIWLQGALPARLDRDQLRADTTLICAEHIRQFGGTPPMPRYDFLLRVTESGYGGLEHRSSSALACGWRDLPVSGSKQSAGYRRLLGLISHEYYHLWNVKRIRPAAVADSALDQEAPFSDLWAYEGVTSYYDNLGLIRSGVITVNRYLGLLAEDINRLQRTAGRQRQSLAESGYEAWIKLYRPTPDTPNLSVSYYNKGALVALMLDLHLRIETQNSCDLDEIMREMAARYDLDTRAVPEHGLEAVCAEYSGLDISDFAAQYIYGCDDLLDEKALPALLNEFGVLCTPHDARAEADRLWSELGIMLKDGSTEVAVVAKGAGGQAGGLLPGDELLALNGRRLRAGVVAEVLAICDPDEDYVLHYFRDGLHREARIPANCSSAPVWSLKLMPEAGLSEAQRDRQQRWLYPDGSEAARQAEEKAEPDD